jgi:MFS family permease
MKLIFGFVFFIIILGAIAKWLYWMLMFLLQSALTLQFLLPLVRRLEKMESEYNDVLEQERAKGTDEFEAQLKAGAVLRGQKYTETRKKLFFVGALFTFVFCVIWTFIVGYLVLLGIANTSSFGWHKWIFIVGGCFLAMSLPSDEKSQPQDVVAYPTTFIFYILQVLVILFVELPKVVH